MSSVDYPYLEISAPEVDEAAKEGDGKTPLREQRPVAPPKITVLSSIEFSPTESGATVAGEAAHEAPTSRGGGAVAERQPERRQQNPSGDSRRPMRQPEEAEAREKKTAQPSEVLAEEGSESDGGTTPARPQMWQNVGNARTVGDLKSGAPTLKSIAEPSSV